jgi:calcineurin-like phosphoesterase family protein
MENIIKDGSNVFFTSDTHFNHKMIVKFCDRPYETIEEHDEDLIRKWNEKVNDDSIIFHLGDFGFGPYPHLIDIARRLKGKKILLLGNHDWKNIVKQENKKFDGTSLSDCFEEITQQLFLTIEGQKIYLNHFPFLCMNGVYTPDKIWQLFGHVHSRKNDTGLDKTRLSMLFPTQYDVGVDNNHFTPLSFNEIKTIIEKQIIDSQNN